MSRRRGPPTAEDIRASAERSHKHFLPERVLARLGIKKPAHFYVYGITLKGKRMYLGPISEDEAETIASNLYEGEIFEMTTIDLNKATREIKAELIKRGQPPDEALQRMYHTMKGGD